MKKKGYIGLALAVVIAAGAAGYKYLLVPQAEGVCRLKTVSSVPFLYETDVVHFFWALDEQPASLSGVPDHTASPATFYSVPFKHRRLDCCLLDGGDNDYTIYADMNGNGSLSDETPLRARRQRYEDDFIFLFGPLSLTDDASTAPFYLFLTNFTGGIHRAPVTVRTGKIRIGDSVHKVMLADLDFDSRYITRFSPECLLPDTSWGETLCDRLLFDLDADESFNNLYFERMECMPLCSLIRLEDRFYAIGMTDDMLTAVPQTPPTGTCKLNTAAASLMLYSDTYCCFMEASDTMELPAGHYSVISAQNSFKDVHGALWTCRSKRRSGAAGDFVITQHFPTRLNFPTAFKLRTEVAGDGQTCQIGFDLVDENGTVYSPLLQKNYETIDRPVIKICDGTNKVIHTGTMEYG